MKKWLKRPSLPAPEKEETPEKRRRMDKVNKALSSISSSSESRKGKKHQSGLFSRENINPQFETNHPTAKNEKKVTTEKWRSTVFNSFRKNVAYPIG